MLKAVFLMWTALMATTQVALADRDDDIERNANAVDSRAAEAKLASLVLHGMGSLDKIVNGHETMLVPKKYLATKFKQNAHAVQAYREALRDCLTPKKARSAGGETARSFGLFLDQYSAFLSDSVLQDQKIDVRMLEEYSILIRVYVHGLGTHGDRRELRALDESLEGAVVEIARTLEATTAPGASIEDYVANKRVENKAIPHPWTHALKAIDLVPTTSSAKVCPSPDSAPIYSAR